VGRPQDQELTRIVPVIDRVMDIDPLVTLQPDQSSSRGGSECTSHLGLAHPGLTLQQQRLLERERQMHRQGQRPVGQVALGGQGLPDVLDLLDLLKAHTLMMAGPRSSTAAPWAMGRNSRPASRTR